MISKLIEQAEQDLHSGDYVGAIENMDEALREGQGTLPKHELSWLQAHRGECLAKSGDFDKANTAFSLAIELRSDYSWAWAHWGEAARCEARDLHAKAGDATRFYALLETAIDRFDEAIKHANKNYAWAYAHRAATGTLCALYESLHGNENENENENNIPSTLKEKFHRRQGAGDTSATGQSDTIDQAVYGDFQRAQALRPGDAWIEQFEAIWETLQGNYERAEQLAERALKSGAPRFLLNEGLTLTALYAANAETDPQRNRELRARALDRANGLIKQDPTNATAHLVRAAVYKDRTDETGQAAYEHALSSLEVLKAQLEGYIQGFLSQPTPTPDYLRGAPVAALLAAQRPTTPILTTEQIGKRRAARKQYTTTGLEARFIMKRAGLR